MSNHLCIMYTALLLPSRVCVFNRCFFVRIASRLGRTRRHHWRGRRVDSAARSPGSRNDTRELSIIAFCSDAIQFDGVATTQSIYERHDDEEVTDDDRKRRLGKRKNDA